MGLYLNIGNKGFQSARNGEYVDKSGLIGVINSTLFTKRRFSCVSRCRRFGKSMAAEMLAAYYDESCDSRGLFADLQISQDPSFDKHLNQYPVIYIDMSDFTPRFKEKEEGFWAFIEEELKTDVLATYPNIQFRKEDDLMNILTRIAQQTGKSFILIIDEWDAICREFNVGSSAMDSYVEWLRRMFKSVSANLAFAAVYMTGILPIKKYKTESALNNFIEYSMVNPGKMASYFGFTKDEVHSLCDKHGMNFSEMEKWYDGYQIGDATHMYNPNSVMMALWNGACDSYWASTGAYDTVATYVQMNFKGLKDDIFEILAGGRCFVDTTGFQNDLSVIKSKNDVLTALIHLGYFTYDWNAEECYLPNKEVKGEMENAVNDTDWEKDINAGKQKLMNAS